MREFRRATFSSALAIAVALLSAGAHAQKPKAKGEKPPAAASDSPYAEAATPPAPAAPPTPGAETTTASSEPEPAAEATKSNDAKEVNDPGKPDTLNAGVQAYQKALARRRLAATAPLSRGRIREELSKVEEKLADGRRDEAIGDLVYLIESPRFTPFAATEEGRNAMFLLGDSLGRAGAIKPARGYLAPLLSGSQSDVWYRRAVRSLVDFGLESEQPEAILGDLAKVGEGAPEEMRADVAYLRGRTHEKRGRRNEALAELARVTPRSRFWAQATYLSGMLEVERGAFKKGENLFCKVADPKLTPKQAPLFGGSDFFRVRDLSRLALGRVAHEQFRFDDARYYYYLVPRDSDHLPEALYEAATTRYEAKDYEGSRDLMDELRALNSHHPYEDEAWVFDAYLDLAMCRFLNADAKLAEFLKRYEPVRDAARRVIKDDKAMQRMVEAVRTGADPAASGVGGDANVVRTLGALLRVDASYGRASQRHAQLEHQLSGLRGALGELDEASRRLATPKSVRPQAKGSLAESPVDKVVRIESQLAEVKRLLREAERSGKAQKGEIESLGKQVEALEIRARAARAVTAPAAGAAAGKATTDTDLAEVIRKDRERAVELYESAEKLRVAVEAQQLALAKDALTRLDRRLSRLLRRARLGKVETVLGRKRALELEVEALSQGLLPQTIVDSLDAQRYLQDDEEYWPFDGEDWEDEYVGGEGLR
ncbi:MAG: hypothetical protein R3B13_02040 [Polyangiaceae bacterium]